MDEGLAAAWKCCRNCNRKHFYLSTALHLGSECGWNTRLKKARYTEPFNRLGYIIRSCKNNNDQGILLGVDKEVMSCFALAHIESNKELAEVIEVGFYYLEKNTQNTASALGSFYNYYEKGCCKV